ncbi:DUF805 domain-containing protein [Agromyces sp. NPDC057865]|uniref:DUF805 domain-containing protein n=1 Tax=Agromyces sp. NPDC057865 TaxID=3346267 RepID=UPI003671B335
MSFGEAIQTVVRKYAEFEGRAGRAEFWWWTLFYVLVASALGLFSVVPFGEGANLGWLLTSLWGLAALLPTLAVGVRRLRDAGYGWGHMFWVLVPIAGLIVLVIFWIQPTKDATAATDYVPSRPW